MFYLIKIRMRLCQPQRSSPKFALKQQAVERFGGGQQFDSNQLPDELFKEQAERRVRLGILLGATVKKLELQADADRVRALIDEMAAAYDDPDQVVNFYYSNDDNLKQIEALAVEKNRLQRCSLNLRK